MRRLIIIVCSLYSLCSYADVKKKDSEEIKINKNFYIVDTLDIEDPIILTINRMPTPSFICSNSNIKEILKDRNLFNRDDVYILGDEISTLAIINNEKIYEKIKLKNCVFNHDKIYEDKKYTISKYNMPVRFLLTLVSVAKTNEIHNDFMYDCVDNSCKKEKRYYIKIKHPNNFYNRIVYPLCE